MKKNIYRITCDICKRDFDFENAVKKANEADQPINELVLPFDYYDETGACRGVTIEKVDVCNNCMARLCRDLSEHYMMRSQSYAGVRIERH